VKDYIHIGNATDLTDPGDRRIYRILEILPGFLAWITLIAIVILSFLAPRPMALFIIAFDIYWLIKTLYLSLHIRVTFAEMRRNITRDWFGELAHLSARSEIGVSSWQELYHLVILPMATEPLTVVRESFRGLASARYPLEKMIIVLAIEERVGKSAHAIARAIQEEFGNKFFNFLITVHPDNVPGEIRGKGSNEAWAGREAKKLVVDPLNIPYEHIIASVFDVDTVIPEQFFACLTWHFLTAEKPLRSSFQPIPMFVNNIWEAPAFARIFAFSTTFWKMIQQARPERLVTFSSQSISFKALVDVNFWQRNVVSEDSRIFWQCLLYYDGDWQTVPLNFPAYMDANVAPTFWQTLQNQYKQIRRWAWGVENNPYFLFGFLKNKNIPWQVKWNWGWFMVESTHSLATNSLIIFLLGWLPVAVGGAAFNSTILSYNLPHITRNIMNIAMFGLVSSAIMSVLLLPPRPPNYGKYKYVWMLLQWILFPLNMIFFGSIPALDAQTRLMVGKYMGFWVTPKSRTFPHKATESQIQYQYPFYKH